MLLLEEKGNGQRRRKEAVRPIHVCDSEARFSRAEQRDRQLTYGQRAAVRFPRMAVPTHVQQSC